LESVFNVLGLLPASAPPGVPFVLLFWWSCPLYCVFFPLGAIVGNGSLMLVTAIGVCVLGCFSFFWWLSVGAWGAAARLGCSSSSLAWLRWRLSCGLFFLCSGASVFSYLIVLCSFCSWFVLLFTLQVFFFFLLFFFFFSSFFLFFLFLAFFFFGCLCFLWSPSCFPCLVLPGVWPSLVLGLVGLS